MAEGLNLAASRNPDYFLFTDADIFHAPQNILGLVSRAAAANLDLASLMVKLECRTMAERSLFPAFLFFFLKLYPPAWIASTNHRTAGAAGGGLLICPPARLVICALATSRGAFFAEWTSPPLV